jgi:acyl carrier protein
MNGTSKLRRQIGDIFLECFDTRLASDELDLIEARLVDSVRVFDLVLEERFGLSLPFEALEIEDFRSVARLADLVARSLPEQA